MGLLLEILTKHRQLGQTIKLIRNIYIACTLYVQSYTEQWHGGIVAATSRIFRNNLLSRAGKAVHFFSAGRQQLQIGSVAVTPIWSIWLMID